MAATITRGVRSANRNLRMYHSHARHRARQRQRAHDQHEQDDDSSDGHDDLARALDAATQPAQQHERARDDDSRRAHHLQHERPRDEAGVGRQDRGRIEAGRSARDATSPIA